MHRRVVKQGNTTLSDRAFVWDQGRLIEEYEIGGGGNQLVGRYYYASGDWPVAADLLDINGQPQRVYYLCDNVYSVVGVANELGQVIERVTYDPWGQAVIQKRDVAAPVVAQVVAETGGALLFQFSETVFPPVSAGGIDLVTSAGQFPNPFSVTAGAQPVSGQVELVEDAPNAPFGSVVRFTPASALNGAVTVQVQAGGVFDEWGNGNLPETLNFAVTGAPAVVFTGATTDTAPERTARSAIGNPFLFQGQYFDYEAGFCYLRARFYDPFTGQFLQRDPMQYEDSVNLYAGFANNPIVYRDPDGRGVIEWLWKAVTGAGNRVSKQAGKEALEQGVESAVSQGGKIAAKARSAAPRQFIRKPALTVIPANNPKQLVSAIPNRTGPLAKGGQHVDDVARPAAAAPAGEVMTRSEAAREIARLQDPDLRILTERVYRYDGRDIVVVQLKSGRPQAFYRSTGTSGSDSGLRKQVGEWEPFNGLLERGIERVRPTGYFQKFMHKFEPVTVRGKRFLQPTDPALRDMGRRLKNLDLEEGVETGIKEINDILESLGAPALRELSG